jgi:hypothetical protein
VGSTGSEVHAFVAGSYTAKSLTATPPRIPPAAYTFPLSVATPIAPRAAGSGARVVQLSVDGSYLCTVVTDGWGFAVMPPMRYRTDPTVTIPMWSRAVPGYGALELQTRVVGSKSRV